VALTSGNAGQGHGSLEARSAPTPGNPPLSRHALAGVGGSERAKYVGHVGCEVHLFGVVEAVSQIVTLICEGHRVVRRRGGPTGGWPCGRSVSAWSVRVWAGLQGGGYAVSPEFEQVVAGGHQKQVAGGRG